MLIKTLLNKIEKYLLFVYKKIYLKGKNGDECLIIELCSRSWKEVTEVFKTSWETVKIAGKIWIRAL